MRVADAWRMRLRADLTAAMKARDTDAVSALRTMMAAIDNAEAVALPDGVRADARNAIAGATSGVGSTEVARRVLTQDEIHALVLAQVREREDSAATYRAHGRSEDADRLLREASILQAVADAMSGPGHDQSFGSDDG